MILSDLLDLPVRCEGEHLGWVIDVRFVLDGPARSNLLADARLLGVVVGPRQGAAFLGFERHEMRGPALVRRWLRRREEGAFLLDWADVLDHDGAIEARPGFGRWTART